MNAPKKRDPADTRARARTIKPQLTAATDDLNKSLMAAETYINDLKLGVRAWVDLYPDEERSEEFCNLVYGKLSDKWGMFIEEGVSGREETDVTLLMNATRNLRMRVADRLEDLLEAIVDAAHQEFDMIQARAQKAASFAHRDREKTPDYRHPSEYVGPVDPEEIKSLEAKLAAGQVLTEWEQNRLADLNAALSFNTANVVKTHTTPDADFESMPVPAPLEDGNGNLVMQPPPTSADWRDFAKAKQEQEKQHIRSSLKKLHAAKGKVTK